MCFNLYPAKVQLFPGLGIYSGIFAVYLQCVLLKESRTTSIVFYALCILYILSTVTVVSDILDIIIQVSNNSICKYIIFYQLYSCGSVHYQFKFNFSHCYFALRLSRWQQTDVVTSSPNVHWYAQTWTIVPIICFIHPNLQRSTVVGSCGVKVSVSWLFLHSWQSHT